MIKDIRHVVEGSLPHLVTSLPIAPGPVEQALIAMRKERAVYLEAQREYAELQYAKYQALVKAGFTEAQAVELCK